MAEGLVPVQIFGQRYPIRSALDPQYVQELASYVDERMRAAADQSPAGDSLRLAVLAALNIADEAFRVLDAEDGRPATALGPPGGHRAPDRRGARRPNPGFA